MRLLHALEVSQDTNVGIGEPTQTVTNNLSNTLPVTYSKHQLIPQEYAIVDTATHIS